MAEEEGRDHSPKRDEAEEVRQVPVFMPDGTRLAGLSDLLTSGFISAILVTLYVFRELGMVVLYVLCLMLAFDILEWIVLRVMRPKSDREEKVHYIYTGRGARYSDHMNDEPHLDSSHPARWH